MKTPCKNQVLYCLKENKFPMLSKTVLQKYQRDGYAIIDNFYQAEDEAKIKPVLESALKPGWGGSGRFPCTHPIERGFADVGHHQSLMKFYLHPDSIEISRQVLQDDVLLRCGILVDLGTGEATDWHQDVQGKPFMMFMHYRGGASKENGCLRVIPGSHLVPCSETDIEFDQLAVAQNHSCSRRNEGISHPKEIPLIVNDSQIIIRDSRIWHSTFVNHTQEFRLLLTWGFIRRKDRGEWQFPFPESLKAEHFSPEERKVIGWDY